jgi:hypothetical protein
VIGLVSVGAVGAAMLGGIVSPAAAVTTDTAFGVTQTWQHVLSDKRLEFYFGSPGVGNLDGQGPDVIVGNQQGKVYAWHVSDGSSVAGWPYNGGTSIQSTPAIAQFGSAEKVILGIGASPAPTRGGYLALRSNGTKSWFRQPYLLPGGRGGTRGVMSSMAVGPIQSTVDTVGGAMGQLQMAINASNSKTLAGFPWLQADTNFSSPALADLNKDGHDEIIEGGDSSKGVAGISTYKNGGHIRILGHRGNFGKKYTNEGLVCQYNTNQVVQSSPAVGGFLTGNKTGIVVGTGSFFKGASDTDTLIAVDTACRKIWSVKLSGNSHPSPAVADVNGDGTLDVMASSENGIVYALKGANGHAYWTYNAHSTTIGSLTTFQAPGANFQYVLVPTAQGIVVLDGRNGSKVGQFGTDIRLLNSAAVTADPNGAGIGITIAGMGPGGASKVEHFVVNNSSSVTNVNTYGAWPQFHHDPQLTGYAPYVAPVIP